jgi:hypothetical protein
MHQRLPISLLAIGVCLVAALNLSAAIPVAETDVEFLVAGDFDGDGRLDAAVVDRASGAVRFGYLNEEEALVWLLPRASGVANPVGVAAGRLLSQQADAVALASPEANRIQILGAQNRIFSTSRGFSPLGIGPGALAALPSASGLALANLAAATSLNDAPYAFQAELMLNAGAGFISAGWTPLESAPTAGNPFQLYPAGKVYAALSFDSATERTVLFIDFSSGSPQAELMATLPAESRWLGADMLQDGQSQLISWVPGEEVLRVWLKEGVEFSLDFVEELGRPIRDVFHVETGFGPRLLVIYGDGEEAELIALDGSESQSFDLPGPSRVFTGALRVGDLGLILFNGAASDRRSSGFEHYSDEGGWFTLQGSGLLPTIAMGFDTANLLLFSKEPFVSAEPRLVERHRAGEWTEFQGIESSDAYVSAERFRGSALGLGDPKEVIISDVSESALHGIGNQIGPAVSMSNRGGAFGPTVPEPSVIPAAGRYSASIQVQLQAAPGHAIYWRNDHGSGWQAYSEPFWVYKATALEFYAQNLSAGLRSSIRGSSYSFTLPPELMDSDGDGVPDFVEIAMGLDPLESGPDADGDGVSDLEELLAGTDPSDPTDLQSGEARDPLNFGSAYRIEATPQSLNGATGSFVSAADGTRVEARDLSGRLLASALAQRPSPGLPAVARLQPVTADRRAPLVALSTGPRFDAWVGSGLAPVGRELLAIAAAPVASWVAPSFIYDGRGEQSALAWIEAAQASETSSPSISQQLRPVDTLKALLVERMVAAALASRDDAANSRITLFPSRPADAARHPVSYDTLVDLQQPANLVQPAFRLTSLLQSVVTQVEGSLPGSAALRALATDIYRISSLYHDEEPGALLLPADALRWFLENGELPAGYVERTNLTENQLSEAAARVGSMLAAIAPRPTSVFDLEARADSFAGGPCTVLWTPLAESPVSLVNADGRPYRLPGGISLLPGSRLKVTAYTDLEANLCSTSTIEVIFISLDSLPAPSLADADGNLLGDDWERVFFGRLGVDPWASADGSGFSNLHQYLAGTDPTDPGSIPDGRPLELGPPAVRIGWAGLGLIRLDWNWPVEFASAVRFDVQATTDLGEGFFDIGATPTHDLAGQFSVNILPPEGNQWFFRLALSLP